MAYSDFTLDALLHRFGVTVEIKTGLFSAIAPVSVGADFAAKLGEDVPFAVALDTEKARSEFIIAPLLLHLWKTTNKQISVFSGVEFNVERKTGLTGFCDFLLSRSPNLLRLDAPVACLVEAKKEDLNGGLPQCVAEMVAAQKFNEKRQNPTPVVYGCVTSGTTWRFVQLVNQTAYVDLDEVYIADADKIFGVLLWMARGTNELGQAQKA